jgi:hypothetical protein
MASESPAAITQNDERYKRRLVCGDFPKRYQKVEAKAE